MRIYKVNATVPFYVFEECEHTRFLSVIEQFLKERIDKDLPGTKIISAYQPESLYRSLSNWIWDQQQHFFLDVVEAESLVRVLGIPVAEVAV